MPDFLSLPTVPTPSASANPVRNDDTRLSNARTPTAHASTHATGGSDVLTPAAIGAYKLLTATAIKTSAYTTADGEIVTCDDSGGSFTVTLPAATNGRVVGVRKFVSSANTVTLQRAGTDTIGGGGATSLQVKLLDQVIVLHSVGGLWVILWDFIGLPSLDARFQPLDSDLTTISGLTATTDSFMQAKAGAWSSRTIAQVKSDLAVPSLPIAESDVTNLTTDLAGKAASVHTHAESDVTSLVSDLAGKVDESVLTTKGDLYAASAASTPARVGVGSDGQVLTADSTQAAGVKWAAAGASADPTTYDYPITGYGLVAASIHPDNCSTSTTVAAGSFLVSRMYVPANTLVTGGAIYVATAGATPGSTNASGFALFSDTGTRLAITANDYTLFTSTGWHSKAFTSTYTTGSTGEFLRLGMVSSCSTGPAIACTIAANNVPTALRDTSRTSTTVRRQVQQASVTTFPISITPSTYGTTTTNTFFHGIY